MRLLIGEFWAACHAVILGGDQPGPAVRTPLPTRQFGLLAGEEGMISVVTVVVVLGFAVLIGLIGNVGRVVAEKIELQNAADAAANASALWMARGMNAITATNHLMGEATALVVIHQALGGPELEGQRTYSPPRSTQLNEAIEQLRTNAPIKLGQIDRSLIEFTANRLTADSWTRHQACATIYDAKLTLKWIFGLDLGAKNLANLGFTPTPLYAFTAPLAFAAHVFLDLIILQIAKEALYVDFLEIGARALTVPKNGVWNVVIPALSKYGDLVAGRGPDRPPCSAVSQNLELLGSSNRARLDIFPAPDDLSLPVVSEPPPETRPLSGDRTGFGKPPSLWTKDDMPGEVKEIRQVFSQINRWLDQARGKLKFLEDSTSLISEGISAVGMGTGFTEMVIPALPTFPTLPEPGKSGFDDNPSLNNLPELPWKAESRSQWTRATYPYVDSFRAGIRSFFKAQMRLSNASTYFVHWTNRYTLAVSHERRKAESLDQSESSQRSNRNLLSWLRGKNTDLRAWLNRALQWTGKIGDPVDLEGDSYQAIFKDLERTALTLKSRPSELGEAAAQTSEWIDQVQEHDRIVLARVESAGRMEAPGPGIEPNELRDGTEDLVRIEVLDELLKGFEVLLDQIEKYPDPHELGIPHMYVLDGMEPERKGREDWTWDKGRAEQLFTVIGLAHRQPRRPSIPTLFRDPGPSEHLAFAQAIFYNANGRTEAPEDKAGDRQPDTGWDTLNWEPPVAAPEWGADPSGDGGRWEPWKVFTGGIRSTRGTRVKLNWQAKLVPVTRERLSQARANDRPGARTLPAALDAINQRYQLFSH